MTNSTFFAAQHAHGRVSAAGDLKMNSFDNLCHAIHHEANVARYPDITLDFLDLTSFTTSVLPPLAAYLRRLVQDEKIDFTLIEPRDHRVKERLVRTGIAHYINYRKYSAPRLKSSRPTLMQFRTTEECDTITQKIVNSALRSVKLSRQHVAALEWAISEITDNVINHSESRNGGFIIHNKIPHTNIVEFTVADSGIGVSRTLNIPDPREAVECAVQEGVTKDKINNQGNGLYGTYRLALASKGLFILRSWRGNLYVTRDGETHVRAERRPYPGTIVTCQVDCDEPELIKRAFVFDGKPHVPGFDYIERLHENDDDNIVISAYDICKTFGSRESGREARLYIENMIRSLSGETIEIDFSNILVISSSFADEVFGKLFVSMGAMKFMRIIKLKNVSSTVEALIDRAINLRAQTGMSIVSNGTDHKEDS